MVVGLKKTTATTVLYNSSKVACVQVGWVARYEFLRESATDGGLQ